MEKKYCLYKPTNRLYKLLFVLLLISILLYGCFKLRSIDHPTTGQTNSYFDVTFVCDINGNDQTDGRGYFGALLPKGWRAQDYTKYLVSFSNASLNISGKLAYDQYYTDQLNAAFTAPAGYYWWGGRSIDKLELRSNNIDCNDFTFTFRVYTDDKTGDFNLRYVIGTDGNGENPVSNGKYVDEQRTISITAGNAFPMQKTANWELISNGGWDSNIKYYSDKDYDGFFQRWNGWTGSDIGITTLLPDGRSVWVWGDTFTGFVLSNRTRSSDNSQFVRNTFIVQDYEDFSGFRMTNNGNVGTIEAAVPFYDETGAVADEHKEWYWPSEGVVYYRNGVPELQVLLGHCKAVGTGVWDVITASTDIAVFSLPDLKLKRIAKDKHLHNNSNISFAGQIMQDDDGVAYIYGSSNYGICGTATFVARCVNGDLTGEWEFYNAKTKEWSTEYAWQNNEDWLDYKISDYAVFPFKDGGKIFAMEQAPCFSRETYIHEGDSPIGPFHNRKLVGMLPEEISVGDFYTYIPALHPQLSKNGELMYCISKNHYLSLADNFNAPGSADLYLPYFFRVKNWRDKLNIVDMDITDNKGTLTAQYEDGIDNLTDNSEASVYSASAGSAWVQYESPSNARLNRYTITSSPDSPDKDPMHWKVLGSNNGTDWTVLDERYYAEFDDRLQTVNYTVPITHTMFTHFRLDVLATKGGAGLQIAEWQMFGEFEYEKGTEAALEKVIINGEEIQIQDVMTVNIPSTSDPEVKVKLSTKDFGSLVGVDNSITAQMDKAGILNYTIKVVSEDGLSEKEYKLVLNRWFAFDDIVNVKWNNTLMLFLNRLESYNISGYQWYKNDAAISGATGKSYSAGNKKTDLLDPNSTYHIQLKTPDGELRSETKKVTLKSMTVSTYPNPVKAGQPLTLVADIDEDLLKGAFIEVYNIQGNKISTVDIHDRATAINMPSSAGVYMLKFRTKSDFGENLKVVVK